MLRSAFFIFAATLAGISVCAARPSTTTMSCAQAAATVAKAGAIVLTTGELTYERFVATSAFCLAGENADPGIAPTKDSRSCTVGYVCRQRERVEGSDR